MKENLIMVFVALAMCLPFVRMLSADPFQGQAIPHVHTPTR